MVTPLCLCVCRSDEEMVKFMQLMNSIWNICGKDAVTAFDLSLFKVICDLGGKCVLVCVCARLCVYRVTGSHFHKVVGSVINI